jgi:hypothetical protein
VTRKGFCIVESLTKIDFEEFTFIQKMHTKMISIHFTAKADCVTSSSTNKQTHESARKGNDMKKVILALTVIAAATAARADGFVCQTESGLNVKVYNHTDASEGTRNGAMMILSDSTVGAGNKTVATFSHVKGTLASSSANYVADVDLRFSGSNRKGELLAGTKLGEVDMIVLSVDFSYAAPVEAGVELTGELTLIKRNGQEIIEQASCQRYLKN